MKGIQPTVSARRGELFLNPLERTESTCDSWKYTKQSEEQRGRFSPLSLGRLPASGSATRLPLVSGLPVHLSASPGANLQRDRGALRVLDACLQRLEDAHERGETVVTEALARKFGSFVLGLTADMPISEALELVFKEQENVLRPNLPASIGLGRDGESWYSGTALPNGSQASAVTYPSRVVSSQQLSSTEARELTHQIKLGMCHVSSLLLKAHDGRAWSALAYSSWAEYVHVEFGFSRSRSYELLEHARVLQALTDAAGVSGIPDISPYATSQIKPHLPELIHEIRIQAAGRPEGEARNLVSELVGNLRASLSRSEAPLSPSKARMEQSVVTADKAAATFDMEHFLDAVEYLASMPSVRTVMRSMPQIEADRLVGLPSAARWLTDFAAHWVRTRALP